MKNVIDSIRVEATSYGSDAGQTMFPRRFTPKTNSGRAGGPPIQWAWARLQLDGSHASELEQNLESFPPRAGDIPLARVKNTGACNYLIHAENHRSPIRAAGCPAHVSSVASGPVCAGWGDDWLGKVAFHPPVQGAAKR
jgi:hypothetical protein